LGHIFEELFKKAEYYLDTRENDVHVPMAYDFAKRLLKYYPEAEEDIVLPGIILHDVGWKMVPEDEQLKSFGPNMTDKEKQHVHEVEGVKIAEEILVSLKFDEEKILEILEIIDGHDTRKEPISLNDKLVKDADKLWRFTPTGIKTDYKRFHFERGIYLEYLAARIDEWFFTLEAKDMARKALTEAEKEP